MIVTIMEQYSVIRASSWIHIGLTLCLMTLSSVVTHFSKDTANLSLDGVAAYWLTGSLKEGTILLILSTNKSDWTIELLPNRELKSLLYAQYQNRITKDQVDKHCYFHGHIQGHTSSWAAVAVCHGIRGVVFDGRRAWELTPELNTTTKTGRAHLRDLNMLGPSRGIACGLTDEYHQEKEGIPPYVYDQHTRLRRDADSLEKVNTSNDHNNKTSIRHLPINWQRFVEVWIVVDRSLYAYLDSDRSKVHRTCQEIMNIVNSIFKPLQITTVLVGVEIWEETDRIGVVSDHEVTLSRFKSQRYRLLQEGKNHDYTILLTAVDFLGDTVGYAYVSDMCHFQRSSAVVQYELGTSSTMVAGTIAHEMGHGFGARHDTSRCKTDGNDRFGVMAQKSTSRLHWSNCTRIYVAKYIDRFHCLKNIPDVSSHFVSCGNGFIDPGEQCDCGVIGPCSNCCFTNNCTLKLSAVCGSGLCCNLQKCSPLPVGSICRPSTSECDLPEYCSGSSEFCPKNVYKYKGFPCDNNKGHCFDGICGSGTLLCKDLINPAAKIAEGYLLDTLRRHSQRDDCKEFFCQTHLNIGWVHEARSIISDHHFFRFYSSPLLLYKANASLYANRPRTNGILCDKRKMCAKGTCIDIPKPASKYCAINCSNHGLCNSEGHCHCQDEFGPPDCLASGYGGSIDSGHARSPKDENNYFLIFVGVFPCIIFICCLWPATKEVWDRIWYPSANIACPKCATCLNSCFCPCMIFLTRWTTLITNRKSSVYTCDEIERKFSVPRTPNMCDVDVSIITVKNKNKSCGVTNSMLTSEVMSDIHKNPPEVIGKIRFPSDSPISRAQNKPTCKHSIWEREEDDSRTSVYFSPSMGSLINLFSKFDRPNSQTCRNDQEWASKISHPNDPRIKNLRHSVVDNLSSNILCGHKSLQTNNQSPTGLRCSLPKDLSCGRNTTPLIPSSLISMQTPISVIGPNATSYENPCGMTISLNKSSSNDCPLQLIPQGPTSKHSPPSPPPRTWASRNPNLPPPNQRGIIDQIPHGKTGSSNRSPELQSQCPHISKSKLHSLDAAPPKFPPDLSPIQLKHYRQSFIGQTEKQFITPNHKSQSEASSNERNMHSPKPFVIPRLKRYKSSNGFYPPQSRNLEVPNPTDIPPETLGKTVKELTRIFQA